MKFQMHTLKSDVTIGTDERTHTGRVSVESCNQYNAGISPEIGHYDVFKCITTKNKI